MLTIEGSMGRLIISDRIDIDIDFHKKAEIDIDNDWKKSITKSISIIIDFSGLVIFNQSRYLKIVW